MNFIKNKLHILLNIIYVVVTALVNVFGYFRLPDVIATQFGSDSRVNHMPKAIYLPGSFLIILILAVFCIRTEPGQRIKYLIINTIIFVANIIMILVQI